jgi:hypothetical protein
MSMLWWVIIGLFLALSICIFYWIYKLYKALIELISALCELHFTFRKFKL